MDVAICLPIELMRTLFYGEWNMTMSNHLGKKGEGIVKICIYGAGAVGGFIGAQLAHAGYAVNAVARGATLEALRTHGLRLESNGTLLRESVRATDNPAELGVQDLVVVAVKAPALVDVARQIAGEIKAITE